LDCSACDIFLAPQRPEIAEKLLAWFQQKGYADATTAWFHCCGCPGERDQHWSADCAIRACCFEEKGLRLCSDCPDFACDRLKEWAGQAPGYQAAFDRLAARKQPGT
jgi:hypothetical protein